MLVLLQKNEKKFCTKIVFCIEIINSYEILCVYLSLGDVKQGKNIALWWAEVV